MDEESKGQFEQRYNDTTSRGTHRILNPQILYQFPYCDRPHALMPPILNELFFNMNETVFTEEDKEEEEKRMASKGVPVDKYYELTSYLN